jgi:uncharacterized membrane protein
MPSVATTAVAIKMNFRISILLGEVIQLELCLQGDRKDPLQVIPCVQDNALRI